ncbi:MAG TPA: cation:dicarboxylase symporter family transporter, partial [Microvirga sp.]|nr:cation:dicarboxylase symporter family transporter [Microvirga sp.]
MIKTWFARPLWQRVAVAFALGILAGVLAGENAALWFKPLGDVYLNLVRMIVIPLVFFTIASSVAKLAEAGNVARLGARTLFWFIATSALAVLVGIAFGHLIDPGLGLSNLPLGEVKPRTIPSPLEVLIGIVPTNPVKAMADTNVLQVLFFAGIVGAALVSLGDKAAGLRGLVDQGSALVFRITRWVLQLTPIGTFGLIAWVVGRYGLSSLLPLGKFIGAM